MKRRASPPPAAGSKRRAFSPPLPPGWSRWHDKTGRPYFINDEDGTTTWEDPRAPVASAPQPPPRRESARPPPQSRQPPPHVSVPAVPWLPTLAAGSSPKHPPASHRPPTTLVPPVRQAAPPQRSDAGSGKDSTVQLHVSGLDPSIDEKHVRDHFRNYEQFVSKCIRLKDTYCFLHFGDHLGPALAAIAELDGQPLMGRMLRVRLTKNTCEQYGIPEEPTTKPRQQAKLPPQQPAAPPVVYPPVASHRLPAGASPVVDEPVQVHVSGLHPAMTEDDIRDFFRSFKNRILKVHCKADKGFAFVHLDSIRAARAAIEKLNGRSDRQGTRLRVDLSSHDAVRYGAQPPNATAPRAPRARQGPPARRDANAENQGSEDDIQLFVGGLAADITVDDIWRCFSDCPVSKVHRVKDSHCFIHLPDINTALDVMRDKEGSRCGSRIVRIALSSAACKRYNVPPEPHRKPQLILRRMPPDGTVEDVRVFLADHSGVAEEITPGDNPGEWSVVVSGVQEALDCYASLDGKYFLGSTVELALSDASSRCLNLPPRPEKK
eukprot:EG_transcript_7046